MLWLCVQLPEFPLEICSRGTSADEPLAISEGEGREQRIVAATIPARRAGIQRGMRVSEANALTQRLRVRKRDRAAEEDALARLAGWCGRYTPVVSLAPPDALLLEVEGSRNLYGGFDRLIEQVQQGLSELGYTARLALAPTPLAATWLAQAGRQARLVDHAKLFGALAALPLTCLALAPEPRALLRDLGVVTLVDCLRLPRDGLARRAGPQVLDLLDRAFGRKPDPRPAFIAPARFHARLALPAPVSTWEALLFPLHRLLLELAGFLLARGLGASVMEIILAGTRDATACVPLRLVAPTRDPHHLARLVRERLARLALVAPVEEVALEVVAPVPLAAQPADFFTGRQTPEELRAQMLEQLQARLGREAVRGLATHPDHRPERAWCTVEPGTVPAVSANARRPVWLLPEPMALETRDGRLYWEGPLALEPEYERVESGWWDGAEVRRDYFIAHHPDGRRLWVLRNLNTRRWYLHGIFG